MIRACAAVGGCITAKTLPWRWISCCSRAVCAELMMASPHATGGGRGGSSVPADRTAAKSGGGTPLLRRPFQKRGQRHRRDGMAQEFVSGDMVPQSGIYRITHDPAHM